MPWLLFVVCSVTGITAGMVFGIVRGVAHVPTLVFAILEGAFLFGAPAAVLGLLLVALWSLGRFVWRELS